MARRALGSNGSAFRALRHPHFRRFYVGSWASQLGFWFSHVSFQALMADLTDDELWVSMLFVVTFAPVLFFGPYGGILADRLDRKKLLLSTYVAVAALATGLVVLVATDAITPLLLLAMSSGVGLTMAVLGPTAQAITADTVPREDLPSAISLQSMGPNAARVLGPALAAPLIASGRYEATWSVYAAGAAIAFVAGSGIALNPFERDADSVAVLERFRQGLRHAGERADAGRSLRLVGVVSVFAVSHITLAPAFTEDALGRPAADFAWLGVATGIGAIIGAASAGVFGAQASVRRGAILALPYCSLLIVFSRTTNFWLALALQLVMGFFYIASFTTLQVVVQSVVDDQLRGRVMSLFQIAWAGLLPFGSLALGLMAGSAGLDLGAADTTLIAAVVPTVYLIWTLTTDRAIRGQTPGSDPSDQAP